MAKRVFFSFHYQDVSDFRANVVRNHGSFKLNSQDAGFFDASMWEQAKKESSMALKRLINNGLTNTSNTCILVGSQTYLRPWVRYEILKSFVERKHIFGVHINCINGKDKKTKSLGTNPFDYVGVYPTAKGKLSLIQKVSNGKWEYYTEIDNKHSFTISHDLKLNKVYSLSNLKRKVYYWYKDDGYNNFSTWLK